MTVPRRSNDAEAAGFLPGRRGVYVRAEHTSLPVYASDMLALRIGQLRARGLSPRKTRGLVGRCDRNFHFHHTKRITPPRPHTHPTSRQFEPRPPPEAFSQYPQTITFVVSLGTNHLSRMRMERGRCSGTQSGSEKSAPRPPQPVDGARRNFEGPGGFVDG